MALILTVFILCLVSTIILTKETRWVHICLTKTKEVSCQIGEIIEVTEIYSGYRETGCSDDFTGSITDITSCSRRAKNENLVIQSIAKACKQTNVCNITAINTDTIFGCFKTGVVANFNSFSFTCTMGTSTAAPFTPSTSNIISSQPTESVPKITNAGGLLVTEKRSNCTSGQLAAVTISLFFVGLVLGAIGMLCFNVHRGIPDSLTRCTRCRKREDSTQGIALQKNINGEERTDYYNVNTPDQGQNVGVQSGSSVSNGNEGVNTASTPEDINLQDVRVYSELQNIEYLNGPDSALYDTLK